MALWAIELSKFDVQHRPHIAMKGQVVADFIAQFTNMKGQGVEEHPQWIIHMDRLSNRVRSLSSGTRSRQSSKGHKCDGVLRLIGDHELGCAFTLGGGAIGWRSVKQSCITDSTMKAEYVAACEAAKEAVWLKQFLSNLGVVRIEQVPITLFCDNSGVVAQSKDPRKAH
nr:uncharacterized protein LOC112002272 [Quercus suber]